ncbi:MAG TPA: hypothetical protein VN676_02275, partial [Steroidobacteraceae bacterium]|nr:hypothetical protein [Steroidobacteraceae bacterium]
MTAAFPADAAAIFHSRRGLSCPAAVPTLTVPSNGATPMALFRKKSAMPTREQALPGRSAPLEVPE